MSPSTTAQRNIPSNGTVPQFNAQSSNNNQRMRIFSGGRQITEFSQINIHHSGDSYSTRTINGKQERVRAGTDLVVKDFVAKNESGSTRVPVRTPVSGYVQKGHQEYTKPDGKKGGAGYYVDIYDKPDGVTGRKRIGRMFHLESESPLQNGSYIVAGTAVGIQGNTGGSTGTHHHIETLSEVWPEYIRALQTGNFSNLQKLEVNRNKSPERGHVDSAANSLNNDAVNHTSSGNSINNSGNTTADSQDAKADLKKVVALMIENAAKIKNDFGIDITNAKGLGEAVTKYWIANNLAPETLREQLPTLIGEDAITALSSTPQAFSKQPNVNNQEYAA